MTEYKLPVPKKSIIVSCLSAGLLSITTLFIAHPNLHNGIQPTHFHVGSTSGGTIAQPDVPVRLKP